MASITQKHSQGSAQARIRDHLRESIDVKQELLGSFVPAIAELASILVETFRDGGKVVLCGNGGSVADAQHVAAELVGRFQKERRSLPALALTTDSSILTAIGNDFDFNLIFARQVEALLGERDLLVGISTSGTSPNVLEALDAATRIGARSVGVTGASGAELSRHADFVFYTPSNKTAIIQEAHLTMWHAVCDVVKETLFPELKPAVFLDRDGTLNEEVEYIRRVEEVQLLPDVGTAVRRLNTLQIPVIVITNQSAIARGILTEDELERIHRELCRQLAFEDGHLDAIYYCPHDPEDECSCRKPATGLLELAARQYNISLSKSFVVGDKLSDLEAGNRVGCRTVLVLTGYGAAEAGKGDYHQFAPDFVAEDLATAVEWIVSQCDCRVR